MGTSITVLADNTVYAEGLAAEHGFAAYVERDGRAFLFDTGQSSLFMRNAGTLGVDLSSVEAVVLSHGHYDHTGGLPAVLERMPAVPVVAHEDAFKPKYSRDREGNVHRIGIPLEPDALSRLNARTCADVTEIVPGMFAVTDVPRHAAWAREDHFFLDEECTKPDPLRDDLSLVVETAEGLVVLLGCAHAGVPEILSRVDEAFPGRKIRAVLGGTHLGGARGEERALCLDALRSRGVMLFRPGHCTGLGGIAYFLSQGFVRTVPLSVGAVFAV